MYPRFGLRPGLGVDAQFEWNAHPMKNAYSQTGSINQIKKWLGGWCVGLFGGEVGVKSAVVRFR